MKIECFELPVLEENWKLCYTFTNASIIYDVNPTSSPEFTHSLVIWKIKDFCRIQKRNVGNQKSLVF